MPRSRLRKSCVKPCRHAALIDRLASWIWEFIGSFIGSRVAEHCGTLRGQHQGSYGTRGLKERHIHLITLMESGQSGHLGRYASTHNRMTAHFAEFAASVGCQQCCASHMLAEPASWLGGLATTTQAGPRKMLKTPWCFILVSRPCSHIIPV